MRLTPCSCSTLKALNWALSASCSSRPFLPEARACKIWRSMATCRSLVAETRSSKPKTASELAAARSPCAEPAPAAPIPAIESPEAIKGIPTGKPPPPVTIDVDIPPATSPKPAIIPPTFVPNLLAALFAPSIEFVIGSVVPCWGVPPSICSVDVRKFRKPLAGPETMLPRTSCVFDNARLKSSCAMTAP